MQTTYGPEIKEACLVLHLEGLSSREIRDRLSEGKAGLPYPAEPAERTIDKWRRSWKDQGIIAGFSVRAGEESVIEEAIYRRVLGLCRMEIQKLEEATVRGSATVSGVNRIAAYMKITNATKYQRQLRAAARERKLTPEEGGHLGAASAMAKPESMLKRLAEAEEHHEAESPTTD